MRCCLICHLKYHFTTLLPSYHCSGLSAVLRVIIGRFWMLAAQYCITAPPYISRFVPWKHFYWLRKEYLLCAYLKIRDILNYQSKFCRTLKHAKNRLGEVKRKATSDWWLNYTVLSLPSLSIFLLVLLVFLCTSFNHLSAIYNWKYFLGLYYHLNLLIIPPYCIQPYFSHVTEFTRSLEYARCILPLITLLTLLAPLKGQPPFLYSLKDPDQFLSHSWNASSFF